MEGREYMKFSADGVQLRRGKVVYPVTGSSPGFRASELSSCDPLVIVEIVAEGVRIVPIGDDPRGGFVVRSTEVTTDPFGAHSW